MNGQVERMRRTIKEATVQGYHYDGHRQLTEHMQTFLKAYNLAKRLKTFGGLTLYEAILQWAAKEPERFSINPKHHILGLYT